MPPNWVCGKRRRLLCLVTPRCSALSNTTCAMYIGPTDIGSSVTSPSRWTHVDVVKSILSSWAKCDTAELESASSQYRPRVFIASGPDLDSLCATTMLACLFRSHSVPVSIWPITEDRSRAVFERMMTADMVSEKQFQQLQASGNLTATTLRVSTKTDLFSPFNL